MVIMEPVSVYTRSSAHMFLSLVFCENPNSGSRDISDSSVGSWDPFLHSGLPQSALISGFALSLIVTSVTVFSLC